MSHGLPRRWRALLLPLALFPLLSPSVAGAAAASTAPQISPAATAAERHQEARAGWVPSTAAQHTERALRTAAATLPTQSAAEEPDAPATGSQTAHLTITEIEPPAPARCGHLTIRGTVTNNGSSPIVGSSVAPRESQPLSGRRAIDRTMERGQFDLALDGPLVRGHSADIDTVDPGASRTFSLRVPVAELGLQETSVYQLSLTLTGQTEAEQWDQVLGVGRTVLPWTPETDELPQEPQTDLTVMWPLISTTHLSPQTDEGQTPVFTDDALLTEISPGGRLHQMVTLGADLPVSWVIDPDLLASVDAMAEEYQVNGADGPVAGQGQEIARSWLNELRQAVAGKDVVALPFADPDLASLAHQGSNVPGALGQFQEATEMAGVIVETVLGVNANTDFAWPVEGAIDPDIVSVATSASASTIISRSDSVRPTTCLAYTPSAPRPIGGGVTTLVADNRLSQLFQDDMNRPGNVARAHQLLLTHTLAIHQQDPDRARNIVLAPHRMPDAAQAQAMAEALTSLEDGGWTGFTELSEAARSAPDPAANNEVPPAAAYPEELRETELPTRAFEAMRDTRRTLDEFSVILVRPDRVGIPFGAAIQREMSVSWRGRGGDAAHYRASVQNQLDGLTEQVSLIPKSPITLSGRSATIPVTVQNNLLQDVEGLELRLTSSRRLGLEVSEPQEVSVGGGHSQSVKFEANARANGRTLLEAQLYTPDGKPYGDPIRFHAQVTSITSAVLMVIGGGMLLVVLAGVRMYTQRKRAAAREAEQAHAAGDGTGTEVLEGESPDDTGGASDSSAGGSEKLDRSE